MDRRSGRLKNRERKDRLIEIIESVWPEYTEIERIGSGASGKVYRAVKDDAAYELSFPVAIKVIPVLKDEELEEEAVKRSISADAFFQKQLKKAVSEVESLLKLKSSHIVHMNRYAIVESEDEDGYYVLIEMDLLEPLTDRRNEFLTNDDTLIDKRVRKIGIHMCEALLVCQSKNVLHRDIKPENIFVSANDEYYLGDLSVAKEIVDTSPNTEVGTERFVAPEVRSLDYDIRADIYSLGLVLYMLANHYRAVFEPSYKDQKEISYEEEQSAASRRYDEKSKIFAPDNCSDDLAAIILKMCEFTPQDRYQSVEEVLDVLKREKIDGDSDEQGKTKKKRIRKQRNWQKILRTGLIVSLISMGIGAYGGIKVYNAVDGMKAKILGDRELDLEKCLQFEILPNQYEGEGVVTVFLTEEKDTLAKFFQDSYNTYKKNNNIEEKDDNPFANETLVKQWINEHIDFSYTVKDADGNLKKENESQSFVFDKQSSAFSFDVAGLSGSDQIAISFSYLDDEGYNVGKSIGIEFTGHDCEFIIPKDSFKEYVTVDLFKNLEIEFEGYDKQGSIKLTYKGSDVQIDTNDIENWFALEGDVSNGSLKNGDVVNVVLTEYAKSKLAEKHLDPKDAISKKDKCDGLNKYLTYEDVLTQEQLDPIIKISKDLVKQYFQEIKESSKDSFLLDSNQKIDPKYVGYYLKSDKYNDLTNNRLYIVMSVRITSKQNNDKYQGNPYSDQVIYLPIVFKDVYINENETICWNDSIKPGIINQDISYPQKYVLKSSSDYAFQVVYCLGCDNTEELHALLIDRNLSEFNHSTDNVEELCHRSFCNNQE